MQTIEQAIRDIVRDEIERRVGPALAVLGRLTGAPRRRAGGGASRPSGRRHTGPIPKLAVGQHVTYRQGRGSFGAKVVEIKDTEVKIKRDDGKVLVRDARTLKAA